MPNTTSLEIPPPNDLKNKGMVSQFARYVSFNVLGMIGISVYILADTFFIANGIGPIALAALNFGIVPYTVIYALGLMLGIGGGTQFQIFKVLGEKQEANRLFTNTFILALILGAIFIVVALVWTAPLSYLLGADESTFGYTHDYVITILCFAPFFLLNYMMLPFIRNDGSPRLAMTAMLVGSAANIVLDYVFIFLFGWGMFGAAFATGLAPIIGLAIQSIHFIRKHNTFRLVKTWLEFRLVKSVATLGFSSFITEISAGMVLLVFNLTILGLTGNIGVAAYGIVANLAFVANALFIGIAQGIQPLASRGYAMKDAPGLRKLLQLSLGTAFALSMLLIVVVFFFAEPLALAFNRNNDPQLTKLAVEGMRIYFIGYFFAGINIVSAAFFSSVKQPGKGLIVSLIRGFIAILTFVAIFSMLFGMIGVWVTFPAAELLTVLLVGGLLIRLTRSFKEANPVI